MGEGAKAIHLFARFAECVAEGVAENVAEKCCRLCCRVCCDGEGAREPTLRA